MALILNMKKLVFRRESIFTSCLFLIFYRHTFIASLSVTLLTKSNTVTTSHEVNISININIIFYILFVVILHDKALIFVIVFI